MNDDSLEIIKRFRNLTSQEKEKVIMALDAFGALPESVTYTPNISMLSCNSQQQKTQPIIQAPIEHSWYWAFCEAVNPDGSNLIRYRFAAECWRAEIGDLKDTGYTGWKNADATESFIHKGWKIAFGTPLAKERGMRVIRPIPRYDDPRLSMKPKSKSN